MGFYDTFLENDWTSERKSKKGREREREREREKERMFQRRRQIPHTFKGVSELEMAVKAEWELKALRRPLLLIQIVKYTQQRQCAVYADSRAGI
jgi:hypothetical protein